MTTARRPIITDHAMLRYLERVVGIDVDQHRRAMEDKVSDAVQRGASGLISEGFRYAIADQHIVTVTLRARAQRACGPDRESDNA